MNWAGKDKVARLDVPPRVLRRKWTFGEDAGNMVIHGDNLEALKALLPRYEGRVQCIYIDPPYNTGNEGWVYNDNVNDPQLKRWFGQVVGKEGEDFSRHDKWLCMMFPRLKLLRKLLARNGAIFISIDDNELYSLKAICDEILGATCFVADISWQRTYSTRNDSKGIVSEVEHILVYSKSPDWQPNKLPRTAEMNLKYKNPDNDPRGLWRSDNAYAPNAATHQGMVYAIQHPFTGELLYPTVSSCWRYEQTEMLAHMRGWAKYELQDIGDTAKRAAICGVPEANVRQGVKAIMLARPLDESRKAAKTVLQKGPWPRFFFSKNGMGGIARKTYLGKVGGIPPTNLWEYKDVGHTDEAKKELLGIFGGQARFDTPKPVRLLERVLKIATDEDSLVLDSFAGSGTTAHAVLKLNAEDGGWRRFILVESMEYAEGVTAERVKRVVKGYGQGGKRVAGTGGGFGFWELGPAVFGDDGELNGELSAEELREWVWELETRGNCGPVAKAEEGGGKYFLGMAEGRAVYFCHEWGRETVLDGELLQSFGPRAKGCVVYAHACLLEEEELRELDIAFRKVPRDLR